jgi:hypothetical protein
MQDQPSPEQLLQAVAAFLREQVVPAVPGALAFHTRVAANALDISRRHIGRGPAALLGVCAALTQLLHPETQAGVQADVAAAVADPHADLQADVSQLNRELCERIAAGTMHLHTPGLAAALWRITLDKLAVDQPSYDTYVRALRADSKHHEG